MHDLARRCAALLLGAVFLAQLACSGGGDAPAPKLTITSVGWYEENIDPSVWASAPLDGQTAFYDFFVHYEGEVTFADFQSARMYMPNGWYWDLLRDATFLDTTRKVIGGWRRWTSTTTHQLPIGDFWVELRLADGSVVTATRNVPAPGGTTTGGFTSMHTEDLGTAPTDSAPMVRRAAVAGGTLDVVAQTLSFPFSVVDPLAFNGWIWLYDATGRGIAVSPVFRDPTTGAIGSLLGGALHTDGTPNTVSLGAADLLLEPGASFSQIATARVVLTDGRQYATGRVSYDCDSISSPATLTTTP